MGSAALLAWWGRDRDKGASGGSSCPLSRQPCRPRQDGLYLSPLGGHRRDENPGSHGLTWLARPSYWKDRQSETDVLPSCSTVAIATSLRTPPPPWSGPTTSASDPTGTTRVVFPLFWYFDDRAQAATAHTSCRSTFTAIPLTSAPPQPAFPLWVFHHHFPTAAAAEVFPPWSFSASGVNAAT